MKKLMTLALGLSFVLGTVAVAQEKEAPKVEKKAGKKKGEKKKGEEPKKEEAK